MRVGYNAVSLNQSINLPQNECGGTVELYRGEFSGNLRLLVKDSRCANFAYRSNSSLNVFDVVTTMNGSGNSGRHIDIEIQENGQGIVPVLVGSNGYISANGLDKNKEGVQINILLPVADTLPRKWSYQVQQDALDLLLGIGICVLVDSSNNVVAEVSGSLCDNRSTAIPENMTYDYDSNYTACYLWWTDGTRVSSNAVPKDKCN